MIRRPPRSTLFPYTDALPIWIARGPDESTHSAVEGKGQRIAHRGHVRTRDLLGNPQAQQLAVAEVSGRSEEHTSELQSHSDLVCRLLLEKRNNICSAELYHSI